MIQASPLFERVELRRRPAMTRAEVLDADRHLARGTPQDVLEWACRRFGDRLVLTASFAESTLVHLATAVAPDIEVIFLDTGFHFAETLQTVRHALAGGSLNLTVLRPEPTAPDVWAAGTDACCAARKTDVLDRYLPTRADAWLSGLRRVDSPERADTPVVTLDRRGLVKVNPLANMTDDEYEAYNRQHGVLVNPLRHEGYASIGCWPCTEPAADRSGRWAGTGKTECGLHR